MAPRAALSCSSFLPHRASLKTEAGAVPEGSLLKRRPTGPPDRSPADRGSRFSLRHRRGSESEGGSGVVSRAEGEVLANPGTLEASECILDGIGRRFG